MAKGEARGIKSYVPTLRGVVKIFIVLVVLKVLNRFLLPSVPSQVAQYWPAF